MIFCREDVLGMKKEYGKRFIQSRLDFPLAVSLGGEVPDWELSRLGCPLRFGAFDDEGFAVRGNSRRLLYKGRRRSHRFTILDDNHFEYDVILKNEPDTNVIELYIDGADDYVFYRQPDFVDNDFLKGSYAVYRKERIVGEGTGKLCHIHRPKIIDAGGRWVWGGLVIAGNKLFITIPETWLADARYPVIVDPVIGTSTIGSQTKWYDWDDELSALVFDQQLAMNRYTATQQLTGSCTAKVYAYAYYEEPDAGVKPFVYSIKSNGMPSKRMTKDENHIDLAVASGKPAGWRGGTFAIKENIAAGTNIFFGMSSDLIFFPRFDYGGYFLSGWADYGAIPENPSVDQYPTNKQMILSMYFEYGAAAQNYVRVLTQAVAFTDTAMRRAAYVKQLRHTINTSSSIVAIAAMLRKLAENILLADFLTSVTHFCRRLLDYAENAASIKERFKVVCCVISSFVCPAHENIRRSVAYHIKIITTAFVRDYLRSILFLVSRDEIKLKSRIAREIILRSSVR
jgi:hypothetical protein